jgi:uncharacterized membrane protein
MQRANLPANKMHYMKKYIWLAASLLLAACGPSIDPEAYLEERTAQAAAVDDAVNSKLAFRSLSDYTRGDQKWNVQVGYVGGKPVLLKMFAADSRQQKWWIYTDTATGKVNFLKEETAGKDGKGVRNVFGYLDTALIVSKAGQNPYEAVDANDFRLKAAEVNKVYSEVLAAVEADRPDLSKAANDARRQNAQFFAAGNEPGWSLVINPSKGEVVYTGDYGKETKSFGYTSPDQGPSGESIYEVRSLKENMRITIASKWCTDDAGKVYPYTVGIELNGKSYAGCGILLQ